MNIEDELDYIPHTSHHNTLKAVGECTACDKIIYEDDIFFVDEKDNLLCGFCKEANEPEKEI